MGSWDATCALSGLSIGYKDRVVAWPVLRSRHNVYKGGQWSPLGVPVRGVYDTYGGCDLDKGEAERVKPLMPEKYEDLENTLKRISRSSYNRESDADLILISSIYDKAGLLLMHEFVYDLMINVFKLRKRERYSIREGEPSLLWEWILAKFTEAYAQPKLMVGATHEERQSSYVAYADIEFMEAHLQMRSSSHEALTGQPVEDAAESALAVEIFSILRKSYLPDVAAGSQASNYDETNELMHVTHLMLNVLRRKAEYNG